MQRLRFGRLRDDKGYTATEAMTVVAAIGIVTAFAAPNIIRFKSTHEVHSAAWQVGGMLQWVRARAVNEATPYLVLFQNEELVDGTRGAFASIVRDNDRSYSLTPSDDVDSFVLDSNVPEKVRQYGADGAEPIYRDMPPPFEDRSRIARGAEPGSESSGSGGSGSSGSGGSGSGGLLGGITEILGGLLGGGSGSSGGGSGSSGSGASSTPPLEASSEEARSGDGSVAESATNGTTFPVSDDAGVPTIAFNERGIAVSPDSPDDWGTGAGAIYLTDNESVVYATVVSPMGEVSVTRYEPATSSWK